jgi:DNA-binding PadR family transcriptional regulator
MLELAVLGLLHDEDRHGYEMKKRLTELGVSASFGSLYPALNRLARDRCVEALDPAPATAAPPMTGSLSGERAILRAHGGDGRRARGGRRRQAYRITDAGRERMVQKLTESAEDDRSFPIQVAFCRHLTHQQRLDLFRGRRDILAARLAEREKRQAPWPLDRYMSSLEQRADLLITNDLAWLDQLIDDELGKGTIQT